MSWLLLMLFGRYANTTHTQQSPQPGMQQPSASMVDKAEEHLELQRCLPTKGLLAKH